MVRKVKYSKSIPSPAPVPGPASATAKEDQRITVVKCYVKENIALSRGKKLSLPVQKKYADEIRCLEKLIPIKAMGFRGVVLTALVGMKLYSKYNPLKNFYECNPRTLFEHGIYDVLRSAKVRCGKSDPLNVAKNQRTLDAAWAAGRRPESAALAAVEYINWLVDARSAPGKRYSTLEWLFFRRLMEYAESQERLNVDIAAPFEGGTPADVAAELVRFVLECPESGAVPQFVVGTLIAIHRENDSRFLSVDGVNESVFSTNTTAKKPADVWEWDSHKKLRSLYEITVKPVDDKRLDDCVESLNQQGCGDKIVTFICRCPQDVATLELGDARTLVHNRVRIQFVDISEFITVMFVMLADESRTKFTTCLEAFVHDTSRSEEAKKFWADKQEQ